MSNEARSGENVRRRGENLENMQQDNLDATGKTTSRAMLEHYLYGKNAVRALDKQNVQKQRTSDEVVFEKKNNETATLSKGTVEKYIWNVA